MYIVENSEKQSLQYLESDLKVLNCIFNFQCCVLEPLIRSPLTLQKFCENDANEGHSQYRHSSISAVSISAIFNLTQFIILSYFPPLQYTVRRKQGICHGISMGSDNCLFVDTNNLQAVKLHNLLSTNHLHFKDNKQHVTPKRQLKGRNPPTLLQII